MAKPAPNQNPEGVSAVWRAVHKLEEDFEKVVEKIPKPSAWDKTWSWIWQERAWTILAIFTIVSGLVVGAYRAGGMLLDDHIRSGVGPLQTNVTRIDGDLREIKGTLNSLQLRQLSSTPSNPQSIAEAKAILDTAKQSAITIPTEVVKQAGTAFINAASKEPAAWDAALRFVEYSSFLNLTLKILPSPGDSQNTTTKYTTQGVSGFGVPNFAVAGLISKDKAALFNPIGSSLTSDTNYGNQWIKATGGGLLLDGYEIKNVVLTGVHVVYKGGPLRMENVYFVGCTFDFVRDAHGQNIAAAILASVPTTADIS